MTPVDPNDITRRFEERMASTAENPVPEELEEEVAEELGVEGETVEIPPGLVRGILLFELEDGSFGSRPLEGLAPMSLDDAASLADRLARRALVDMVATRVVQVMQQARQAADAKRGNVRLPILGQKVRRNQ